MSALNQANKARALAFWNALDAATPSAMGAVCRAHLAPAVRLRGPMPVGDLAGPDAVADGYFAPLRRALPDWRRETHMFFGGASDGRVDGGADGRMWVCATGYLHGTAQTEFAGIPATSAPLRLRWADFLRFEAGEIAEIHTLIDVADWFEQIGRPVLPPSRGVPFVYPAPTGFDGILSAEQPAEQTVETLQLGRALLYAGLNSFDKSSLGSMGMAGFFHKNVKWYGPGGIGACLSLREFQELHQQPWLIAYPDRRVQDLDALFAEGALLGASGWAGVRATHTGPYLGVAATGRALEFNGIDFWLRKDGQFVENWVFVDMVHLFAQFGEDLFDRMRHRSGGAGQ